MIIIKIKIKAIKRKAKTYTKHSTVFCPAMNPSEKEKWGNYNSLKGN